MKYTLAFDVYGTLINTAGVFIPLREIVGEKATSFMNTWRDKQLEYSFRRAAMETYIDFSECTAAALRYSTIKHQVKMTPTQEKKLLNAYSELPAFPDVVDSIQQLKASGHRLFAFSNGSNAAIKTLLTHANILNMFEGYVSVEDVKVFKPSPKVYTYFNTKTKSKKNTSFLISGNPFDILGAASYGMYTAWVQRSPDILFDPWGTPPSMVVTSLLELNKNLASFSTIN